MSEPRPVLQFGTVIIVGGGCYGSYYVRQLQRAAAAGAVCIERLLVIDRDAACQVEQAWGRSRREERERRPTAVAPTQSLLPELVVGDWSGFFADYLGSASDAPATAARDAIVPSPLMPHLMYQWIVSRLRARWPARELHALPLSEEMAVPWQRAGEDGTHYASFATWMCPINCIEPLRCPHTRAPRDWTMPVSLQRHVRTPAAGGMKHVGPYVFHCTHRAYGVGMIDVAAAVAAEADLASRAALGPVDALIGTVSHCHGAVSRIVVGAPAG